MKQILLTKKDIMNFNCLFDKGNFNNESSLDFALAFQKQAIAWQKKLAHIVRSVLVDHVFEEGNKRTTAAIMFFYIEQNGYKIDEKAVVGIIKRILLSNIISIKRIREMIENGITKSVK